VRIPRGPPYLDVGRNTGKQSLQLKHSRKIGFCWIISKNTWRRDLTKKYKGRFFQLSNPADINYSQEHEFPTQVSPLLEGHSNLILELQALRLSTTSQPVPQVPPPGHCFRQHAADANTPGFAVMLPGVLGFVGTARRAVVSVLVAALTLSSCPMASANQLMRTINEIRMIEFFMLNLQVAIESVAYSAPTWKCLSIFVPF
jgi:hypothetical protein